MTNPPQYELAEPTLIDAAVASLNDRLRGLSWLTYRYGAAQRLTKEKNGVYNYPGIYIGGTADGYLDLLPDEKLGVYSFWDINDPVNVRSIHQVDGMITFRAALVVWGNLRNIYPSDWQGRTSYNLATDILDRLLLGSSGSADAVIGDDVQIFANEGATIYPRYTHKEINRQFLMKPYGGCRIEMDITYNKPC